jgi:hypothetical protein
VRPTRKPTLRETRALLRAISKVIERAENLGEDDLADVMALFKANIARRAWLQRERERLRTQAERRFRRLDFCRRNRDSPVIQYYI